MKALGIIAWLFAGFVALSTAMYVWVTIRRPTVTLTSCLCWWIAALWPFAFRAFNRVHLFWIVPFVFVLPWLVELAVSPMRMRYYYRRGTALNDIPSFSRSGFVTTLAAFLALMVALSKHL